MDQNTLMKTLFDMSANIARTAEIVERHDKETFPKIEKALETIDHASKRMESKQNQDMAYFHQEKEAIYGRLIPLEEAEAIRKAASNDIKTRVKNTIYKGIEYVVAMISLGIVAWFSLKWDWFIHLLNNLQ